MSALRPRLPLLVLIFALSLSSCSGKTLPKAPASSPAGKEPALISAPSKSEARKSIKDDGGSVPRADPGYLQWLEKQSMLADAGKLARIVSGSELPWRSQAAGGKLGILLDAADTWLYVHPSSLLTDGSRPAFRELAEADGLDTLKQAGIRGIFIAPANESGSVWREKNDMDRAQTDDDPVSLRFSEHAGNDKDFSQLAGQAEKRHIQLGGDILSPATGVGPDFALAARAMREYPGAYMMVEIPREHWAILPQGQSPDSLEGQPLNREQVAMLSKERLLPPAMARDSLAWISSPGGWAATGEMRCNDGQLRRWVFRYHKQPARPLLSWEDPSGAAQRMLSGSIIQQVGMLRQALAGIHIDPLFGLDALYNPAQRSLEPAPSALHALAREIRRYGGWSIQRDPVPAGLNAQLLDAGVDFIHDNITSPAAEYALLTGDTAPLRALLTQSLHFDQRRFARGMPGPEGIRFQALEASPFPPDALKKLHLILAGQRECPLDGNTLYATGPSLAALAIRSRQGERAKADASPLAPHLLLTAFRAAMPGLFCLSGADITGALNIAGKTPAAHAVLGGWSLGAAATRSITRKGFERAPTVYPPLSVQLRLPDSYLSRLSRLSAIRAEYKVAQGTLLGPLQSDAPSVLPLLTRLPNGGHLLTVANFSPISKSSDISLPASLSEAGIQDIMETKNIVRSGGRLSLDLDPWACRILLIGGRI